MTYTIERRVVPALDSIDVTIQSGSFVAIVGPSGCGKSTLLRLIADILVPTEGTIRIGGRQPSELRQKRQIGFVFQDPTLLPWRNVLENISLPIAVAGTGAPGGPSATDLLDLVGLRGFGEARPAQLSGGMQQRVAIARALILQPSVLLLDEPFGALDEITRQRMNVELLRIWTQTGTTAILVTHSLSEAIFMADRVLVMSERPGRILADIKVPVTRPRGLDQMATAAFFETVNRARQVLFGQGADDTSPRPPSPVTVA